MVTNYHFSILRLSETSLLIKKKTIKKILTNLRQVDSWWYREFCSVILRNNRSSHGQYLWWGPLQRHIIVNWRHLTSLYDRLVYVCLFVQGLDRLVYDGFNINCFPSILNASRIILESAIGGQRAFVAKILRQWGTGLFLDGTWSGSLTT